MVLHSAGLSCAFHRLILTGLVVVCIQRVERGNAAPFDQEFYLILNLAVGGTMNYWPDSLPGKPYVLHSPLHARH